MEPIVNPLQLEGYGWKEIDGMIVPIWYTCPQLPPSRKLRDSSKTMETFTEADVSTIEPPVKRAKETFTDETDEEIIDHYSSDESDSESSEWEHFSDFSSSESDCDSDW